MLEAAAQAKAESAITLAPKNPEPPSAPLVKEVEVISMEEEMAVEESLTALADAPSMVGAAAAAKPTIDPAATEAVILHTSQTDLAGDAKADDLSDAKEADVSKARAQASLTNLLTVPPYPASTHLLSSPSIHACRVTQDELSEANLKTTCTEAVDGAPRNVKDTGAMATTDPAALTTALTPSVPPNVTPTDFTAAIVPSMEEAHEATAEQEVQAVGKAAPKAVEAVEQQPAEEVVPVEEQTQTDATSPPAPEPPAAAVPMDHVALPPSGADPADPAATQASPPPVPSALEHAAAPAEEPPPSEPQAAMEKTSALGEAPADDTAQADSVAEVVAGAVAERPVEVAPAEATLHEAEAMEMVEEEAAEGAAGEAAAATAATEMAVPTMDQAGTMPSAISPPAQVEQPVSSTELSAAPRSFCLPPACSIGADDDLGDL